MVKNRPRLPIGRGSARGRGEGMSILNRSPALQGVHIHSLLSLSNYHIKCIGQHADMIPYSVLRELVYPQMFKRRACILESFALWRFVACLQFQEETPTRLRVFYLVMCDYKPRCLPDLEACSSTTRPPLTGECMHTLSNSCMCTSHNYALIWPQMSNTSDNCIQGPPTCAFKHACSADNVCNLSLLGTVWCIEAFEDDLCTWVSAKALQRNYFVLT